MVCHVRNIPGASENSEVFLFADSDNKQTSLINATYVRPQLQAVVDMISEEILGFNKDDIGLHSIRSGGAMAMFLSGVSVIII
jgi:hypothetical protein